MKLAVLGESPADEAALRIIAASIIRVQTLDAWEPQLRSRGWPTVRDVLAQIIRQLHYATDVDGLIVVVDSNGSQPHAAQHETVPSDECRLCALSEIARRTAGDLRKIPVRPSLMIALGLAVPCIEAWYLCGTDPHVSEATWVNGLRENRRPYTCIDLKRRVYQTDRPSLTLETQVATHEALRLAKDLATLNRMFPMGFGPLYQSLSRWT